MIALAGDMGSLSLALNSVREAATTPRRPRPSAPAARSSTSPPSRCRRAA